MHPLDPRDNLFIISIDIVINPLRNELVAIDAALLDHLTIQKDTSWEGKMKVFLKKGV